MIILPKRVHTHRWEVEGRDLGLFQRREKLGGDQGCGCHLPAMCLSAEGSRWPVSLGVSVWLGKAGSLIYGELTSEPAGLGLPDSIFGVSGYNTWLFLGLSCWLLSQTWAAGRQRTALAPGGLMPGCGPCGQTGAPRGPERRDQSLRAELGDLGAGAINHTATVS